MRHAGSPRSRCALEMRSGEKKTFAKNGWAKRRKRTQNEEPWGSKMEVGFTQRRGFEQEATKLTERQEVARGEIDND